MSAYEFFFWVAPMLTTAATVASWATLMVLNSPRPYRRDPLNLSIIGVFYLLALYLAGRVLVVSDLIDHNLIDPLYLIIAAGTLSLLALPFTVRELRRTWRERRPAVYRGRKGGGTV